MKVFISHKREDQGIALAVESAFKLQHVDTYLDVLDSNLSTGSEALTKHIRTELNHCTDIIVVISKLTKLSWWVPFEIGMSAQIDMPTASFLSSDETLPSYLSYWPRLTSISQIQTYVDTRKRVKKQILHEDAALEHTIYASQRRNETAEFYRQLKQALK